MTSSVFTQEMERQAMTDFTGMFDRIEAALEYYANTYYAAADVDGYDAQQALSELKAFREAIDDGLEAEVEMYYRIRLGAIGVVPKAASLVAQADKGE